jgi:surface polysaccharide O-acyltransferase-like enzyme
MVVMGTTMGKKRIANFEILRTVAMLFIVFWHFCVRGLTESSYPSFIYKVNTNTGVFNLSIVFLLLVILCVSVNCYVMITGYFMIDKTDFSFKRIEKVWLQTFFYNTLLALFAYYMKPSFDKLIFITTPFYSGFTSYWFVNKYLGLIFLSPFLAKFACCINKQQYQILLIVLAAINISIINSITGVPLTTVMGEVTNGYSLQWFVFLFFIAGYIRKYDPFKYPGFDLKMVFIFQFFLLVELCIRYRIKGNLNIPYNGLCLFISVFLFLWFKNHKFTSSFWKIFVILAPYTFGVYLLHENYYVSRFLWNLHLHSKFLNSWIMLPAMLIECLAVFFSGVIIDYLRKCIVNLIHGDELLNQFNNKMSQKFWPMINKTRQNI